MIILAIDPGQNDSAVVVYGSQPKEILWNTDDTDGKMENGKLLLEFPALLERSIVDVIVIEDVESRGGYITVKKQMKKGEQIWVPPTVGKPLWDTMFWIGRLYQRIVEFGFSENGIYRLLPTKIRAALCNDSRANLSMMTTEIIDHFDPNREYGKYGKGTAKNPGPLFGFVRDLWQATAVALAWERLFEYGKIKYSKSKAIPYSADEEGIF